MKYNFLPLVILPFIIMASAATAEDWTGSTYHPYDIDAIYKEEAAPYIRHVEDTWRIYQVGKESLSRIEKMTTAEYHAKNFNISVRLSLDDLKPIIKSKVQYKGKTIYFVFSYTD